MKGIDVSCNWWMIVIPSSAKGLSIITDGIYEFVLYANWFDEKPHQTCKKVFVFNAHDEVVAIGVLGLSSNTFSRQKSTTAWFPSKSISGLHKIQFFMLEICAHKTVLGVRPCMWEIVPIKEQACTLLILTWSVFEIRTFHLAGYFSGKVEELFNQNKRS